MAKSPTTKHQHTVPRVYLRNFSEDKNSIYRKYKKANTENEELKKPASLKSATVQEHFYTVKSGNDPMLVETLIYAREIEAHYPKYYEMLTNPNVLGLTMEERSRMLMCFLSMHCRTPKQFRLFFDTMIPDDFQHEIDILKEDYKGAHLLHILTNFIAAHQFKIIRVARIKDTSEFITSDNPVLIVNSSGLLKNDEFREQFNIDNRILIPIDTKHCLILINGFDKNGIPVDGKVFYNKIERVDVDCTFTQNLNQLVLQSADKCFYGSKKYMNAFFGLFKLV